MSREYNINNFTVFPSKSNNTFPIIVIGIVFPCVYSMS